MRVPVAETSIHRFKGEFPVVETYPHVDVALLEEDDPKPCYITLPVAEIGRVSANGLLYDEVLVTRIAEQLGQGTGGIRGHIPDDAVATAFPVNAIHWVGHVLKENTLWAKGYVPPGENRNDIRKKIACGGSIGTSIYGTAIKELTQSPPNARMQVWKARDFQLDQIDLAPAKRAALSNRFGVTLTAEMTNEETMPTDTVTLADVPQTVREQIIKQYETEGKAERVAELEQANANLQSQVTELATYKSIVAEIRANIGKDTDTVQIVTEYHTMATKLAELLGVPYTNITVRIEEMHEQLAEMATKAFTHEVDDQIAKLTNWNATSAGAKAKVAAFRNTMKRAVLAEIGAERVVARVAEVAQKLWDEEFQLLGQSIVRELGGPSAAILPKAPVSTDPFANIRTEDGVKEVMSAWTIAAPSPK